MLKSNKGVTLVALVITIIVLLILAGVSISLVVGDNGVLNQAVNAADNTNLASVKDQVELAVSACHADWMAAKYGSTTSTATLDSYLIKAKLDANMADGFTFADELAYSGEPKSATGKITYKGTEYTVKITLAESGNSAKVEVTAPTK